MNRDNVSLEQFDSLSDVLPHIDDSIKNICLLTGSEGGWSEKLAWEPSEKFVSDNQNGLKEFISSNQKKNNLVIGFFSYEFGLKQYNLSSKKKDDLGLPCVYFLAYDNYIIKTKEGLSLHGSKKLKLNTKTRLIPEKLAEPFKLAGSKKSYSEQFYKIKKYIRSGHIYQVNLTHRLISSTESHPRDIFYELNKNNRAGMKAYLEADGFEIISMSPERFIKTKGQNIYTTPIKGTRKRSGDKDEDLKILLNSKKELSELNMITDLLRNDLSKVCMPGSVKVVAKRQTQDLTSVIHTNSKILGKLDKDTSPIEAVMSMFPGGSITGCPKKRAMEIIDELEPESRSAYCGSFACIDPNGDLDSSILIRTIIKKQKKLVLPIGGGIVFDSDVDQEFEETLDKAKSITNVLY